MVTRFAAAPQRRTVHRRGFLSGEWMLARGDTAKTSATSHAYTTILVQAAPGRLSDIERQVAAIGLRGLRGSTTQLRVGVSEKTGLASALASIGEIPGVLSVTLAGASVPEVDS